MRVSSQILLCPNIVIAAITALTGLKDLSVYLDDLAKRTEGFSGREIAKMFVSVQVGDPLSLLPVKQ